MVTFSQAEILTLMPRETFKLMNASQIIHTAEHMQEMINLMSESAYPEPSFARADLKGALLRWSQSLQQDSFQKNFPMPEADFRLIARHMHLIYAAAYHYLERAGQTPDTQLIQKRPDAGTPNVFQLPLKRRVIKQIDPEARPKADDLMHFYLGLKKLVEPKLAALPPRPDSGFVWTPKADMK